MAQTNRSIYGVPFVAMGYIDGGYPYLGYLHPVKGKRITPLLQKIPRADRRVFFAKKSEGGLPAVNTFLSRFDSTRAYDRYRRARLYALPRNIAEHPLI